MRAWPYFWRTRALLLLGSCKSKYSKTDHSIQTLVALLKLVRERERSSKGQIFRALPNWEDSQTKQVIKFINHLRLAIHSTRTDMVQEKQQDCHTQPKGVFCFNTSNKGPRKGTFSRLRLASVSRRT